MAWLPCTGFTFLPIYSKAEWVKKSTSIIPGDNPAFKFRRTGASKLRLLCQILAQFDEVVMTEILYPDAEGLIIVLPQHLGLQYSPVAIQIKRLPRIERLPPLESQPFSIWVDAWR